MIEDIEQSLSIYFEKELRDEIIAVSQLKELSVDECLIDVGMYLKGIPLIMNGLLKISRRDENGQELLLYYLEKGETCSISMRCCMRQKASEISAVAEQPTDLLLIPSEKMEEWMSRYKGWRNFIFTNFKTRIDELLNTVDSIAFKQLDQRLLDFIDKKMDIEQTSQIHITHQEIADNLHTSRVVVSRLLKQLEQSGKVSLGRNLIGRLKK